MKFKCSVLKTESMFQSILFLSIFVIVGNMVEISFF